MSPTSISPPPPTRSPAPPMVRNNDVHHMRDIDCVDERGFGLGTRGVVPGDEQRDTDDPDSGACHGTVCRAGPAKSGVLKF
jgi:hypothetical protein